MNSPTTNTSPSFRNLKSKHKHSPVELKEKMRKTYKDKVQNCRNLLLNRFRGSVEEMDLRSTLTDIYKNMFDFTNNNYLEIDNEESELLEEIKNELVQEELQWWIQEYEKSNMENVDWSVLEQDNNVICPVCQKTNLSLKNNILQCPSCNISLQTQKSLTDIRNSIVNSVDKHNSTCGNDIQFSIVQELNEAHIYLICESCNEMQIVI